MILDIAIQMDPIASLDRQGDTTLALMVEAQRRGHRLFYYCPADLSYQDGCVMARGCDVTIRDDGEFRLSATRMQALDRCDIVLMRQDPPFDMAYLTATYLLERLPVTTRVINAPGAVRDAPEKLFVLRFAELIPPTLISRDAAAIAAFCEQYGDVVVKPLYGNGGADIFRLGLADPNRSALIELFQRQFRGPFITQRYLAEITAGDKRIILIDGEPAGAINRLPQAGQLRANLHVGGVAIAAELTDRDRHICATIGPVLRERGLFLAGIDIIGDYLTEINVTSPTGMREIAHLVGIDPACRFWDCLEER